MSTPATDPFVGMVLENRFEIIELAGHGGMADVYKARHNKIDLTVAVKVLKSDYLGAAQTAERFKREAATVNSLYHPNIIHMYSYDVLPSGQPYLVLAFIEGESLYEMIKLHGPCPIAEARDIFVRVCRGVGHAHETGVLHRDLKPANVMLIKAEGLPEGEERVKVLDFGIAKCLKPEGKDHQQLTQAGEVFGSPLYMSPEQCTGGDLDPRSDVYSMGCLMYETLAAKPPLMGKNTIATIAMHLYEMPPSFKALLPVPDALEAIVFKCMQKNPDDRYQSMAELEKDLEALAL